MKKIIIDLLVIIPLVSLCISIPAFSQDTGNMLVFDWKDDTAYFYPTQTLNMNDDFTLEAWIKIPDDHPRESLDGPVIMAKGYTWSQPGNFNYWFGIYTANKGYRLRFLIGAFTSGYQEVYGKTKVGTNEWVHVAAVRSSQHLTVYVNGIQDGQVARTLSQMVNGYPFVIGNVGGGCWGCHLNGCIDEVRVWKVARSAQQIASAYKWAVPNNSPGLDAYYKFDEALTSQIILDSTPNGNHGTMGYDTQVKYNDPARLPSTLTTYALQYGSNSNAGSALTAFWQQQSTVPGVGKVVISGAAIFPPTPSNGFFIASLAPAHFISGPYTVLVSLAPGMVLAPFPFKFDTMGMWNFPLNLRTNGLGGLTLYVQAVESRSGITYLSNGLELGFF